MTNRILKVLVVILFFVMFVILATVAVTAQETAATNMPAEPQIIQVTTADGLTLDADYWTLPSDQIPAGGAPTVVVLHGFYSSRRTGLPLVEPLMQAGYHVLLVGDYRQQVAGDVQTWLDWLRNQPEVRPDAISTLGSGVGGTTALISCADDEQCVTAIIVSGATSGFGLTQTEDDLISDRVESALSEGLRDRSALLIASYDDPYSETEEMIPLAKGEIGLRLYPGRGAREFLFTRFENADNVIQLIINWLNEHTPAAV